MTDVSPVCGPSDRISTLEVDAAIGKMKQGKSGGSHGVVSEMLKAAEETLIQFRHLNAPANIHHVDVHGEEKKSYRQ